MQIDDDIAKVLRVLGRSAMLDDVISGLTPFEVGNPIGAGGLSLAYEARLIGGGDWNLVIKFPTANHGYLKEEAKFRHSLDALHYEAGFLVRCVGLKNIVQIVEDRSSGQLPFIALERLGSSLPSCYGDKKDLGLSGSAVVFRDIATALEGIHQIGIYHNDVSPENILLGKDGWTLIDPSTPDVQKEDYFENGFHGAARDVLALGRTFVAIYLGYDGEEDVPEDSCVELDEHPKFKLLLRRTLFRGRQQQRMPSATEVRRAATRLISRIQPAEMKLPQ